MIWFSCVHTKRLLNGSLSRVHNTPLKIKRSGMDLRLLKTLYIPPQTCLRLKEKRGKEKKG